MALRSRVFATAAVAASLPFAFAVNAQTTTAPSSTPPGSSSTTKSIPDNKLDKAAAAAKKVVVLNKTYKEKLDKAPDAQKQQISTEANQAMTKAVNEQGLSVDEYMNIMQVAQSDPAVRDKLIQRMK